MITVATKKRIRAIVTKFGLYRVARNLVNRLRGSHASRQELHNFYLKFVRPGTVVFDVGANRGQSSEYFIGLGARVVAFEPQTNLHDQIRQLCGKSNQLTIESCALGAKCGEEILHLTEYDQVASLRDDWEGVKCGAIKIPVSTLDVMISKYGIPDYCKIDAEGWEIQVLSGLTTAVPLISFEYHSNEKEIAATLEVLSRISSLGNYFANPKSNSSEGFVYQEPIPIADLIREVLESEWLTSEPGYGDIFCSLRPELISNKY
jgi:FkbM family methyltransferase